MATELATDRPSEEDTLRLQKFFADKFRNKPQTEQPEADESATTEAPPQSEVDPVDSSLFCTENDTEAANFTKTTNQTSPNHHHPGRNNAILEDRELAQSFEEKQKIYEEKKAAMALTDEDDVEFIKAEKAEMVRRKKFENDREYSRSPSPDDDGEDDEDFVADGDDEEVEVPSWSDDEDDDEEEQQPKKKRGGKRKKADPEGGDSDGVPAPKKKRKAAAKDPQAKKEKQMNMGMDFLQHGLPKAKKPKAAAGKSGKKSKKAAQGHQLANLTSLYGTDVFQDAAATAHLPGAPEFEGTHVRSDALKQLIASVPEEERKDAQMDKKYLEKALKNFTGQGSVKPGEDNTWLVNGMKTGLKHYQVLGAAFLRVREGGYEKPYGGILADEMGLGKTIMMLANIVNGGKPIKPGTLCKGHTTLIVAPPALCSQWNQEIRRHAFANTDHKNGIGSVIQYRSPGAKYLTKDVLEAANIVITTYYEVTKSYPKAEPPADLITAEQKDAWWREFYTENCGLLHQIKFHRVVLDEAHMIKNHKSRVSMACRSIDAKFRWALSGTPIQNNLSEFYPYFKFLRMPNVGSLRTYKRNFITPNDPDGTARLNIFLRKVMVRRTHLDKFMNARILDLPPPHQETEWLDFNAVERQVYEIVKMRFIKRINSISKQKGLDRQYNMIWTMILRLRQLTSHFLLGQPTMLDLLELEDIMKLEHLANIEDVEKDENAEQLLNLRNALQRKAEASRANRDVNTLRPNNGILTEDDIAPEEATEFDNTSENLGGQHGRTFRAGKYIKTIKKSKKHFEKIKARTTCVFCHQLPENAHLTSCYHVYCFDCLRDLQHLAAKRGMDQAKCQECGDAFTHSTLCGIDEEAATDEDEEGSTESKSATKKKGRKSAVTKDIENWITDTRGQICPSAKTTAVKAQIMNWLREIPDVKIIIFTQFLHVVEILRKVCKTEGWGCCTYTGAMSHGARENAIEDFRSNSENKILVASLRAGGLGLNLTMASRCITLDPWWNSAVEQQAFCRMYRIGQTQETYITRVVVRNTIDEAMMGIQDRKDADIASVMNASERDAPPHTVEELMRLFGPVGEDEDGDPFIFTKEFPDEYDPSARIIDDDRDDEYAMMGNEV